MLFLVHLYVHELTLIASLTDGKHTIFGRIYSGMGVIQRMGLVAVDGDDKPKSDVKVHRAFAMKGPPEEVNVTSAGGQQQQYAQLTA